LGGGGGLSFSAYYILQRSVWETTTTTITITLTTASGIDGPRMDGSSERKHA